MSGLLAVEPEEIQVRVVAVEELAVPGVDREGHRPVPVGQCEEMFGPRRSDGAPHETGDGANELTVGCPPRRPGSSPQEHECAAQTAARERGRQERIDRAVVEDTGERVRSEIVDHQMSGEEFVATGVGGCERHDPVFAGLPGRDRVDVHPILAFEEDRDRLRTGEETDVAECPPHASE